MSRLLLIVGVSRYLRVLWGEKIGYEDGLRHAGRHGKRRRKNSDWQISFDRSVQSCVEPCSALFQENGIILDISCSQNSLRVLVGYLTS